MMKINVVYVEFPEHIVTSTFRLYNTVVRITKNVVNIQGKVILMLSVSTVLDTGNRCFSCIQTQSSEKTKKTFSQIGFGSSKSRHQTEKGIPLTNDGVGHHLLFTDASKAPILNAM